MYPLRFEPEQSVSLDLGWGEGRGGLDKGIVFMLCLRSIYTGTVGLPSLLSFLSEGFFIDCGLLKIHHLPRVCQFYFLYFNLIKSVCFVTRKSIMM